MNPNRERNWKRKKKQKLKRGAAEETIVVGGDGVRQVHFNDVDEVAYFDDSPVPPTIGGFYISSIYLYVPKS